MKLVFEKIKYQNLLAVGQQPVELTLNDSSKTLVTGKNGQGKSTLIEAVTFGLFGTPFRKIKKNQLINSLNKKNLLVELWLQLGKDKFYIKRGIKPNILHIEKNGETWDESSSVTDFQKKLEESLGISLVAFKQIVILGTAGYTPFMELTTPKRRELIEELLQTAILGIMSDTNKAELKSLTQEMNLLENSLESLRREFDSITAIIEAQKSKEADNNDLLREEYLDIIQKITEGKDRFKELTEKMDNLVSQVDEKVYLDLEAFNKIIPVLESKLKTCKSNHSILLTGVCPTCNQDYVNKDVSDKLETEISQLSDKIDKSKEKEKVLLNSKDSFDKIKSEISEVRTELSTITSNIGIYAYRAKAIKAKLNETVESIDTTVLDEISQKMKTAKAKKAELFDEKFTCSMITDLLKDSGVKSDIVKKYIPVFNKNINSYLRTLGADYVFTIDTEFNEVIKSKGREDFSYDSFSQGEKARIDLSLMFTWRDISSLVSGMDINLLILDEIGDGSADSEGVKSIFSIIDSLKEKNVIVISHRDEHDKESYGKWIEMKKNGRFTTMEIKHKTT